MCLATKPAAGRLLPPTIYQWLATKSRLHLLFPKSFHSTHVGRRRNGFSVAYEDSKPRSFGNDQSCRCRQLRLAGINVIVRSWRAAAAAALTSVTSSKLAAWSLVHMSYNLQLLLINSQSPAPLYRPRRHLVSNIKCSIKLKLKLILTISAL